MQTVDGWMLTTSSFNLKIEENSSKSFSWGRLGVFKVEPRLEQKNKHVDKPAERI